MKKRSIIFISMTLVFIFVLGPLNTLAGDKDSSDSYIETHYQFDMEKLDLSVENKDILVVSSTHFANPFKQWSAKKEANKLKQYLHKYPDIEDMLVDTINDNTYISAFGYTEAPMEYDETEKTFLPIKKNTSHQNLIFDITANAADILFIDPLYNFSIKLLVSFDL